MNCNRKTFRFLKIEKSRDFARRKNDVEDKMLDTKLKVMEKKERTVQQKLYQIRREKYSRTFYKGPERPKFVDVNVCETEEGQSNKLNLITASGVERTKNSLRRKSIAVEELNPGQVVRVCVSSKLEDKVTRDETATPSTSLPPIVKAPPQDQKRRHSLAIVTNIEEHNMADLFTSVASYMQSISEEREGAANVCKDDLYFGRKTEEKESDATFDERSERNAGQTSDSDTSCSEKLRDLGLQTTQFEEVEEKNRNDCSSNKNKSHSCRQKALGEDYSSAKFLKSEPVRKTETGCNSATSVSFSPKKKVLSTRRENRDVPSTLRSQSSRSYSDSSLQEKATFRKCSTPVPVLSKNHSRMRPVGTSAAVYESASMGHRHGRIRSLSAGSGQQDFVLTEKEAQMAEQVIIRQLEIKQGAERMKKLSLQHFGDSTLKIPRKQSCNTSPYTRRRLKDAASYDTSNSTEGAQRPGKVRRYTHHNPHLLKKFVKDHCKNDRGQTVMKNVLCELSGDLPDCRYLRCSDKASESKDN